MQKIVNWDEADTVLKELAEIARTLQIADTEMNVTVENIKKDMSIQCAPIYAREKELSFMLEKFVNTKRHELIKPKSKTMNFGKVGFRTIKKVLYKDEDDIMKKLEKLGENNCIVTSKKIDKSKFKKLSDEQLKKAGAVISITEEFFYRINTEEIIDNGA